MNTIAISLGDSCIDHYLAPIENDFIGGNALNVAVHMQRAGLSSAYVGAVGYDRYGELVLQALRKEKVNISHVQTAAGPTTRANIRLTANNEPVFIHELHLTNPRLELNDKTLAFIRQHQLVHTSWLAARRVIWLTSRRPRCESRSITGSATTRP